MASVIDELVSYDGAQAQHVGVPTFGAGGKSGALLLSACALARMVFSRPSWDIAHVHLSEYGSFVREGAIVVLSWILGRRAVISLHGARFAEHARRHPKMTSFVLQRSDHILCLGPRQKSIVQGLVPGVPTSLILNPIDDALVITGKEDMSEGPSGSTNSTTYLFAGEVGERKGVDLLLAAWEEVREASPTSSLVIAGPLTGSFRPPFGIGVTYVGVLSRNELSHLLDSVDVSVLPSRAEVLPMFLLESLARGVPAVYSRVGEWEVFAGCAAVTLVSLDNESRDRQVLVLAQAMLDSANNLSPDMAELATRWVREKATTSLVMDKLDQIYSRVMTEQHRYPPGQRRKEKRCLRTF